MISISSSACIVTQYLEVLAVMHVIIVVLPLDYDECSVENGGCKQKCVNQIPGYECQCDSGYSLDSDNMSCVANAECSGGGDDFVCQCLDGFRDETSGNISTCIGRNYQ